jgi:arsenate reductase
VDADVVLYMKTPPSAADLNAILDVLEDPPTALVRRDSLYKKLGLTDDDVATREQVVAILGKHKALLQRPVVFTKKKAIVGRPKDRVSTLLAPLSSARTE